MIKGICWNIKSNVKIKKKNLNKIYKNLLIQIIKVNQHQNKKILILEDNKDFIYELTGAKIQNFKPYIPTLIYQFAFYANYESPILTQTN